MAEARTPEVAHGARDFPVEWRDPEDAQRTWFQDSEHFPYPLTPLSIDVGEVWFQATSVANGLRPSESARRVYPHGFAYTLRPPPADPSDPPDPVLIERKQRAAEMSLRIRQLWREEYLPSVRAICQNVQQLDYASMTLTDLTSRLEECVESTARGFALTMVSAHPMFQCVQPLLAFCEEEFGAEGRSIATVMVQGYANPSSASDAALWKLARQVASLPAVDRALRGHNADELVATLPIVEDGTWLMEALRRHLDRSGWRPEVWFELSLPTWREDPRPALRLVQRYLTGVDDDPRRALARSARRRRRTVRRVRSNLKDDREKLERFDSLLSTASQFTPVSEGRAFWQLTLTGSLRLPCLALGEKLRKISLLDEAADVFYLRLKEIEQIAAGAAGAEWRRLVQERREDRQRWMGVVPPLIIGAPLDPATAQAPLNALKFGLGMEIQLEERVLRGSGASAGIVRARAKVVRTLEEADRVEQGDILVCRTTSPAWTPLFARVAAVVADSGGILSHCSIVAREYAIPCVVGVRVGTERIGDGMLITVDGGQGTVRLES